MQQYNIEGGRIALSRTDLSYAYDPATSCISLEKITKKDSSKTSVLTEPMLYALYTADTGRNMTDADPALNYCILRGGEIQLADDNGNYKPLKSMLESTTTRKKKEIITHLAAQIAGTQELHETAKKISAHLKNRSNMLVGNILEDGRNVFSSSDLSYAYASTCPCVSLHKITEQDSLNINVLSENGLSYLCRLIISENVTITNSILNFCNLQNGNICILDGAYKPLSEAIKSRTKWEMNYIITQLAEQIAMINLLMVSERYLAEQRGQAV